MARDELDEKAQGEPPARITAGRPDVHARLSRTFESIRAYFTEQDPDFWTALAPALVVAMLLFVRNPLSNYIFDEQEALLANPYVNDTSIPFWKAITRDFWGLPPERSIGSYRPLPNFIWRILWHVSHRPFLHHWVNVLVHAINGALLASIAFSLTRRRSLSWIAGAAFVMSAVLTEAVTGVVGIADVLGGLGVLLSLAALRLRMAAMPFAVFGAVLVGLFSKESAIVAVPLIGWVALLTAPLFHPKQPYRVTRAVLAFVAAALALIAYTSFRRHFFPVNVAHTAPLDQAEPIIRKGLHAFLAWFKQPQLPHDPINNPLVDADMPHRVAGALRVYFRGLCQLVFPWTLSGDYSYPQEPIPARVVFPQSVLGAALLVLPPVAALFLMGSAILREFRERRVISVPPQPFVPSAKLASIILIAIGLMWVPIAYFPHSNILVLLPTVRAERFWYLPAVGAALVFAVAFSSLLERAPRRVGAIVVGAFFGIQIIQARVHALHYSDDLIFWGATRAAVPNSAKAHLNYSVMLGARGELKERLAVNAQALNLAPKWPMAHVYYADTLCRMEQPDKAWPHYQRGFSLAPNDPNLIALGLQCLWEHKAVDKHKDDLLALSEKHPGSWLAYLATDIVHNGKEHGGVQKKYRPRGYDEGPKGED